MAGSHTGAFAPPRLCGRGGSGRPDVRSAENHPGQYRRRDADLDGGEPPRHPSNCWTGFANDPERAARGSSGYTRSARTSTRLTRKRSTVRR